ncbi:MAG: hypothetical protein ACJ74U_09095 [Jatrophihabitantaceae bacterium]
MPHEEIAELVARAAGHSGNTTPERTTFDTGDHASRHRALIALVPVLASSAREAGLRAVAAGRWLVDLVVEITPRLPIRDAQTLREHHVGLTDIEIAEQLVKSATWSTAAIGATAGGLAAMEFLAPPTLLAMPAQLAVEMLTVTAVELKMVAELHEILGHPAHGTPAERASLYLMSWVHRRPISNSAPKAGIGAVLGASAKRELRTQLMRRLGRSASSLAPFLAGAVAGAEVNRRATRQLGERLLSELRAQANDRWFHRVKG